MTGCAASPGIHAMDLIPFPAGIHGICPEAGMDAFEYPAGPFHRAGVERQAPAFCGKYQMDMEIEYAMPSMPDVIVFFHRL